MARATTAVNPAVVLGPSLSLVPAMLRLLVRFHACTPAHHHGGHRDPPWSLDSSQPEVIAYGSLRTRRRDSASLKARISESKYSPVGCSLKVPVPGTSGRDAHGMGNHHLMHHTD